jgi:hypothetical protein
MIDTYFDRVDAAQGRKPTPSRPISEDPRYWGGQLYATVIDRHVAEAKAVMRWTIGTTANNHKHEIHHGIHVGSHGSLFEHTGRMKTIWSRK